MPNWCYNTLIVSGAPREVERLCQAVKAPPSEACPDGSRFSIERFYPTPDAVDWYHWRLAHWNTKWDVTDIAMDDLTVGDRRDIMFSFDSAWSPPSGAITKLAELFPTLTFELSYEERGCWFAGRMTFGDGELQEQEGFAPEPEDDDE